MTALKTYNDTKIEYNIIKARLKYLRDRKEELAIQYLGIKAVSYDKLPSAINGCPRDKVIQYLDALEKVRFNGLTINEEISDCENQLVILSHYLKQIETSLRELTGYEERLYVAVVIEGVKPTKAVLDLSESEYVAERQMWYHYSKIKPLIKELKKSI